VLPCGWHACALEVQHRGSFPSFLGRLSPKYVYPLQAGRDGPATISLCRSLHARGREQGVLTAWLTKPLPFPSGPLYPPNPWHLRLGHLTEVSLSFTCEIMIPSWHKHLHPALIGGTLGLAGARGSSWGWPEVQRHHRGFETPSSGLQQSSRATRAGRRLIWQRYDPILRLFTIRVGPGVVQGVAEASGS
jgi:hypothetical protein